ncbi:hypothetical protein RRG08_054947 [Elysia crispata]|uniref:Uncharacterized protein n=1 Tax=Elysia crispata TaxID=231223 RepID=A0AAE0YY24_9GAST|nr:hypothetical protein RRG08_054947 [Elysia crispata]
MDGRATPTQGSSSWPRTGVKRSRLGTQYQWSNAYEAKTVSHLPRFPLLSQGFSKKVDGVREGMGKEGKGGKQYLRSHGTSDSFTNGACSDNGRTLCLAQPIVASICPCSE